jgi:hypothetical protein
VLALGFFMPAASTQHWSLAMSTLATAVNSEFIWPAAAAVDPMIVWGAEAIGPHLGRSTKGAFNALESGRVPGAKKIAGRWALNLRVYHAAFETNTAAA